MKIEYNGKTYFWDETKEWWEQEDEVQEVAWRKNAKYKEIYLPRIYGTRLQQTL